MVKEDKKIKKPVRVKAIIVPRKTTKSVGDSSLSDSKAFESGISKTINELKVDSNTMKQLMFFGIFIMLFMVAAMIMTLFYNTINNQYIINGKLDSVQPHKYDYSYKKKLIEEEKALAEEFLKNETAIEEIKKTE